MDGTLNLDGPDMLKPAGQQHSSHFRLLFDLYTWPTQAAAMNSRLLILAFAALLASASFVIAGKSS